MNQISNYAVISGIIYFLATSPVLATSATVTGSVILVEHTDVTFRPQTDDLSIKRQAAFSQGFFEHTDVT